ncbi:MAG: hypothetical protein V4613_01535 [Bacteroidota bacterium]
MKKYFIGIIIVLIVQACGKDDYQNLKVEDNLTAMNGGLIGLNDNYLFLNKVNDVTLYQLNGTQVKILETYNRYNYQMMGVSDSFVYLSKRLGLIYKLNQSLNLETVNTSNINPSSLPSEILVIDSMLVIFSKGATTYTSSQYYPQSEYGNIQMVKYNKANNSISELKPQPFMPVQASSMAVMNDSLLFYTFNGVQCLNLKSLKTTLTYAKGLPDINTYSYCIGNQLYVVSGDKFYHTSFTNSTLSNFIEIK